MFESVLQFIPPILCSPEFQDSDVTPSKVAPSMSSYDIRTQDLQFPACGRLRPRHWKQRLPGSLKATEEVMARFSLEFRWSRCRGRAFFDCNLCNSDPTTGTSLILSPPASATISAGITCPRVSCHIKIREKLRAPRAGRSVSTLTNLT